MLLKEDSITGASLGSKENGRKQSANRIAVLDGYRALAILPVLAFHYTIRWAAPYDPRAHFPAGGIFNGFIPFEYGWLGVELFFVISGFVILMTLERCRNVADFFCRRFARLWPALFAATALTTAVLFILGPADWMVSRYDYATSILLIDPRIMSALFHHQGTKWVDGAYWSLWVEIRFYILAAFVYLAARKNFIKFWLVLFVAVSVSAVLVHLMHNRAAHMALSLVSFPAYFPYFTLGVCIYEVYSKGALHKLAVVGMAMAAVAILCSAAFGWNNYAGKDPLICVVANLMIFALFFLFVMDNPLVSVFKLPPIVALGQASYSLYLIHQCIGVSIMRRCVELGVPYLVVLPLMTMAIVALGVILFRYVEVPAKSLILRQSRNLVVSMERRVPWLSYNVENLGK